MTVAGSHNADCVDSTTKMRATDDGHAIAIVGIGCRFAGGIDSPASFWQFVVNGADGIVDVPADRWDVQRFFDPDHAKRGKFYVRKGGFMQHPIFDCDALFFGISPREAEPLDPQQRLLLEVTWEALEDAGIAPAQLAGSATGVFMGGFIGDNQLTQQTYANRDQITSHTAVSATQTMLSNRLSYALDLRGPSLSIDTACSSSLVAIHYACQSLRQGESSLALAGGVNVMFRPETIMSLCKGQFLSEDGRSKAFDARADGYGRGEGAGIVVLKPLAAAMADGDRIYAVIRGSGVNQDGRTEGITVPNASAQEALMRQVCSASGLAPQQVGYVEAHGTGTAVGDPLEAGAIGRVYGQAQTGRLLAMGSVKANIGHTEAAAGVAGTIKTALTLHHRCIPPLAGLQDPNPAIPFTELGLELPRAAREFVGTETSRFAAVNSFGYGGTNAHIVVQQAPESQPRLPLDTDKSDAVPYLLPLSARSDQALKDLASAYIKRLRKTSAAEFPAVCYAASKRRSHLTRRLALLAATPDQAVTELQNFLDGVTTGSVNTGRVDNEIQHDPVFVFTGMGPQWWAMGRELLAHEAVFRREAHACDEVFRALAGWSILDEMGKAENASAMHETQIAQPANFVLQAGLAALWRSWGIEPAAIVGHSVGEVTAAYVAGVLSLDDAVKVSYHRSRIQKRAAGTGKMLAVGVGVQQISKLLATVEDRVSVAAVNGPGTVTLAGDGEVIDNLVSHFEKRNVFNRVLRVEVPYHSPRMDPLLPEVRQCLSELRPARPSVPLYSTVTGDQVTDGAYDAEYWCRNIRQPVLFAAAIESLYRDGHHLFLEVGPNPVLSSSIKEVVLSKGGSAQVLSSLRRGEPEVATMHKALTKLYAQGGRIHWDQRYSRQYPFVDLPKYPWQRERYWHEPVSLQKDRLSQVDHPLLGLRLPGPICIWEQRIGTTNVSYLADHVVDGLVVVPGAAYVELGLAVHKLLLDKPAQALSNVRFKSAMVLDEHGDRDLRVVYEPQTQSLRIFSSHVGGDENWTLHSELALSSVEPQRPVQRDIELLAKSCAEVLDVDAVYAELETRGLHYGDGFRRMQTIRKGERQALVRIEIDAHTRTDGYVLCPTLLDAAFQSIVALIDTATARDQVFLPVAIDKVIVHAEVPDKLWVSAVLTEQKADTLSGDIVLLDDSGQVVAEVQRLECHALASSRVSTAALNRWRYVPEWRAESLSDVVPSSSDQERWLVFDNADEVGPRLAKLMDKRANAEIIRVVRGGTDRTVSPADYVLTTVNEESLREVLTAAGPVSKVVYCWGMDAAEPGNQQQVVQELVTAQQVICQIAAAGAPSTPRLYVVTCNALSVRPGQADMAAGLWQSPLVGLARVAVNEFPALRVTHVDISGAESVDAMPALLAEIESDVSDDSVAVRGGERYVERLTAVAADATGANAAEDQTIVLSSEQACRLDIGQPGQINSLRFKEVERQVPEAGHVEIAVKAVGLNFKDIAKVMNVISDDALDGTYFGNSLGMEAAGTVVRIGPGVHALKAGDNVVVALPDCFRSYVTVPVAELHYRLIPASLDLHEAAGIPTVFITVHYALKHVARLVKGETILIHSAAGGVGLAAIQLAQAVGAEVIATVGSDEKAAHLRGLGVQHILHSRTLDFTAEVLAITQGRGVDVILNALPGEFITESLKLMAPFGRFVELGKRDMVEGRSLPMRPFNENLTFSSVDFDRLTARRPDYAEQLLSEVYDELLKGNYRALPTRVFGAAEVKDAFTLFARAQHIGKVVVSMDARQKIAALPLQRQQPLYDSGHTYLITGGLGGFGLAVADWLLDQGIKHLVLVGRNGANSPSAAKAVSRLNARGADVLSLSVDVANRVAVREMIAQINNLMPPLGGIFHAAGVLDDASIVEMDADRFAKAFAPKAMGAWNLHLETQDCQLDHFVMFSSVAAVIGNARQSNYVAANLFLDCLSQYRRVRGLCATTVNWGAIADAGMAADHQVKAYLDLIGLRAMPADAALTAYATLARTHTGHFAVADVDWARWSSAEPTASSKPRFAEVMQFAREDDQGDVAFKKLLSSLTVPERVEMLSLALAEQVADTLKIPSDRIELGKPLTELGLDSLMAVELQAGVRTKLGVELSTLELLKGASIVQLAEQLLSKLNLDAGSMGSEIAAHDALPELDTIDTMTDQEVEHLLAGLSN